MKQKTKIIFLFFVVVGVLINFSMAEGGRWYKQGINALAEQDYIKAAEYFQKDIKADGANEANLNNLGFAYHNISKKYVNDAYKHYKRSLSMNKKNEETLENIGTLYIAQGNLVKANEILKELEKLESSEAETLKEKLDKFIAQVERLKKSK